MPTSHRLGPVALRVQDMERGQAFDLGLGLQLTWDPPDWACLERSGGGTGITLLGPECKAAGPHFALHFCDRAEVDGTASFSLKELEGNWLEMLCEPEGGIPSNVVG